MNRHFTLSALAAVGLMVTAGALVVRAAEEPLPPGTIVTVAGTGKAGFSGDGGPATQARLDNPHNVVIDGAGNLIIGDNFNACVRWVSPDGTITTVAGTGRRYGFAGDGGPATQARLQQAAAMTLDAAGNLYIADRDNLRVRKVDPNGIITTVAGGGDPDDGLGDGGLATAAKLVPLGLAVDPKGNLFICDTPFSSDPATQRVRKVDPAGIITTVAGGGHPADGRGDGGLAIDAQLSSPWYVALDPAGNMYIADNADNRVRRVSPDGKIATVAGGGKPADGLGDGGPATDARLDGPAGITVDAGGNLFIAENHGERVRKVSATGIITTVAGTGKPGYSGDGGPATTAQLGSPVGVCVDRAGNLFFTECDRYALRAGGTSTGDYDTVRVGNSVVRKVIGVAVPQ